MVKKKRNKSKRPSLQKIYGKKHGDTLEKCVIGAKKTAKRYGRKINPYAVCQSKYHFKGVKSRGRRR